MPNVKDCPGFETFGADVQQAREAVKMSRRVLAEKVGIDPRYLANIELCGTIPSVPVVMQLIRICKLPAERYFNPELLREDSEQRQRTSHKLQLCPEKYLPIVEGVIDGAIKLKDLVCFAAYLHGIVHLPGYKSPLTGTDFFLQVRGMDNGKGHGNTSKAPPYP